MGAPPKNTNRLTTGRRTNRHGIVLATLGGKYPAIQGYIRTFRKGIEALVIQAHGTLSLMHLAEVNAACRYELTALVAQRLIADSDLQPDAVMGNLKTVCWATRERNAALARLGVDGASGGGDAGDPWATFDAQRAIQATQPPTVESSAPAEENATDASTEPQEGNADGNV